MRHDLEAPCEQAAPDWDGLYLARGDEVVEHRPVFTGDVFGQASVKLPDGSSITKAVVILQHPCALRVDGVALVPKVLVAEVRPHNVIEPDAWTRYGKLMPLPDLYPEGTRRRRNQAGFFDRLHMVTPEQLGTRDACLTPLGVNLLLQRWVHHNSRVIVPTHEFDLVTQGPYEETDLTEEWTEERLLKGMSIQASARECHEWIREPALEGGPTRQELLADPQRRSSVRRAARAYVRDNPPPAADT